MKAHVNLHLLSNDDLLAQDRALFAAITIDRCVGILQAIESLWRSAINGRLRKYHDEET